MKPALHLALTLFLFLPATSHAAVVYSGTRNIPIPTTFDGIYLNLDAGTTSTTPSSGWDLNLFLGGVGIYTSSEFLPVRSSTTWDDPVVNVVLGTQVNASTLFYASGVGASHTHLGPDAGDFPVGSPGILGFRFTPDSSTETYNGWVRLSLTNNQLGGLIHDWAYENTGAPILAGSVSAIPEPGRPLLAVLFTLLATLRRRRPLFGADEQPLRIHP